MFVNKPPKETYLSNTLTNLCVALYCIIPNCIVLLIYCYVDFCFGVFFTGVKWFDFGIFV